MNIECEFVGFLHKGGYPDSLYSTLLQRPEHGRLPDLQVCCLCRCTSLLFTYRSLLFCFLFLFPFEIQHFVFQTFWRQHYRCRGVYGGKCIKDWFVCSVRSVQRIARGASYSVVFMGLAPGFRHCNNLGRIVVCKGPHFVDLVE